MNTETYLARFDVRPPESGRPVAPVPYLTSAFAAETHEEFCQLATATRPSAFYTRYGNPTVRAFEDAVARLEGADAALATPSGMAAIHAVLATFSPRRIAASAAIYAGTRALLGRWRDEIGADVCFFDATAPGALEAALGNGANLVLLETPANPLMHLTDLAAAAALARAAGAITVVDNTVATPLNQRPLDLGCDLVVHSATKALCGHGDATAGIVAGSGALVDRLWRTAHVAGVFLDPFSAWLVLRGLRTLALRVARHCDTALELARRLEARPEVTRVHYPGLETHPQHSLARRQMARFGGLLSFEVRGGEDAAARLIDSLRGIRRSASFGAPGTLVVQPGAMWSALPGDPDRSRPPPGLVRLGVGLEDVEDLWSDVGRAVERSGG